MPRFDHEFRLAVGEVAFVDGLSRAYNWGHDYAGDGISITPLNGLRSPSIKPATFSIKAVRPADYRFWFTAKTLSGGEIVETCRVRVGKGGAVHGVPGAGAANIRVLRPR
jgi:hypothetical protein